MKQAMYRLIRLGFLSLYKYLYVFRHRIIRKMPDVTAVMADTVMYTPAIWLFGS